MDPDRMIASELNSRGHPCPVSYVSGGRGGRGRLGNCEAKSKCDRRRIQGS